MKTKDRLISTAMEGEAGFHVAIIDLLGDLRNSLLVMALEQRYTVSKLKLSGFYKEAERVLEREMKDNGSHTIH